jgi:hypothetical protein
VKPRDRATNREITSSSSPRTFLFSQPGDQTENAQEADSVGALGPGPTSGFLPHFKLDADGKVANMETSNKQLDFA